MLEKVETAPDDAAPVLSPLGAAAPPPPTAIGKPVTVTDIVPAPSKGDAV